MGKRSTIVFFRGRIKWHYKKPEKNPIKAGPFLLPENETNDTENSAGPFRQNLSPVHRYHPHPIDHPHAIPPRLRRRFTHRAPEDVHLVEVPEEELKKHQFFHEEDILLPSHKIIWRYNPWSGRYTLGNAAERRHDRWTHFCRVVFTDRSHRMREAQHALAAAAVLMVCMLGFGPRIVLGSMAVQPAETGAVRAVDVYCEGTYMGIVPCEEGLRDRLHDIEVELHDVYDMDVVVGSNLTYKPTVSSTVTDMCLDETLENVVGLLDIQVKAYVILVDGQVYGRLRDRAEAQGILDRIIEEGRSAVETESSSVEVVGFAENVEIREGDIYYNQLNTAEDVYKCLTCTEDAQQVYQVQSGDTLWGIADKYHMDVDALQAINPSLGEKLKVGSEIMVHQADRVLDILTAEIAVYDEEVPYQIEEEKRRNMYTTQSLLVRAGSAGVNRVTAKIYRCNGIEQDRDILNVEVISEPVNRIVAVGTIEPALFVDNSRGDGRYIWPTQGRFSSPFGMRWGRMHTGIDISNLRGTPIYAADGGTVIYARRKSGYGNLIILYHGDGRETYYGHLNAYASSEGQTVEKGQLIGYMGNTGRSTGPHLHFEIRINGVPQNPLNFLN